MSRKIRPEYKVIENLQSGLTSTQGNSLKLFLNFFTCFISTINMKKDLIGNEALRHKQLTQLYNLLALYGSTVLPVINMKNFVQTDPSGLRINRFTISKEEIKKYLPQEDFVALSSFALRHPDELKVYEERIYVRKSISTLWAAIVGEVKKESHDNYMGAEFPSPR